MHVRFAELAKLEFDEARAWYWAIRPELGRSFPQEVRTATQCISIALRITGWIAILILDPSNR